ncbi:MAG: 2-oxoglutarate ferredoxin oxidoreductase subunit beta [Chloroflexi bacterium]|nr:2-oxoglutarate ferredoxin oxidoreductase subunit beta [Chloroflexota bacterium]
MIAEQKPLTYKDYSTPVHINWCPACGDFGIVTAIQKALAKLQIPPHRVAMFSGIGCSGKTPHYINAYGFHTLHGRVVPNASGGRLANRDLTVIAVGGDGDGYGIGSGYFVNAGRRNLNFTYLVFDNGVYGLTKGQAAPTLARGMKTKSMPEPAIQDSLNPIALAIGSGYTFVARGYALDQSGDVLANLIAEAIQHEGSSFVDILQTCPTYNDLMTVKWFNEKPQGNSRLYQLTEEGYEGVVKDVSNPDEIIAKKAQAVGKSYEWGDRVPLGIFYQARLRTYEEELEGRLPNYGTAPLIDWDVAHRDVSKLLGALR